MHKNLMQKGLSTVRPEARLAYLTPDAMELRIPSELRKFLQLASFFLILGGLAWGKAFLLPLVGHSHRFFGRC
jgi:hypothetical protein